MSISEDAVLNLVGMAYDAALDEKKWPIFLDAFTHAVNGSSTFLRIADFQMAKASFAASVGRDPSLLEAYANHFVKLDYFAHFFENAPLLTVNTDQEGGKWGISPEAQRKTEYYNDFLRLTGTEYAMGAVLFRNGNQSLQFATQRSERAGEYGEEQIRLMSMLAPHVSRAVQIHRRFGHLTTEKGHALGALDQLRMGVILTNSLGSPLFVNRSANSMMELELGIGVQHGRLVFSQALETNTLHKLISDAARPPGTAIGGDMRIALPAGESLHCLITPISQELSARWGLALESGCVAVFLSKPSGLHLAPKRLANLYGLTPAEARLAARLASLRSLAQAADDLCITTHTVRSQLKSIFAKTGTQCQSELLMLLATGTLALSSDGVSE